MLGVAIVAASAHLRGELDAGIGHGRGIEIVLHAPTLAEARALGFGQAQVALVDADAVGDEPISDGVDDSGPSLLLLVGIGDDPREAWRDGASVLRADAPTGQIVAALHAAAAGLQACSPGLAGASWPAAVQRPVYEPLTPREHEVLRQMSFGLGNREIAAALHISPHTAKFHVAQVIAKLDAGSRAHAVANALRAGLVDAAA